MPILGDVNAYDMQSISEINFDKSFWKPEALFLGKNRWTLG